MTAEPLPTPAPAVRPVRRARKLPKGAELLADELRGRIIADGLQPGDRLASETELIDESGLSRGIVREALRLLEVEGLIRIRRGPRGGIEVAAPDLSQISRTMSLLFTVDQTPLSDFFAFRLLVEPYAARTAALNQDEAVRHRLADFVDLENIDPVRAADFHHELGECAGNEILRVVLGALHQVLDRHIRIEAIEDADVAAVQKVHARIAQAIIDGDPDGAEKHMRRHLEAFQALTEKQGRLGAPIVPRERWLD